MLEQLLLTRIRTAHQGWHASTIVRSPKQVRESSRHGKQKTGSLTGGKRRVGLYFRVAIGRKQKAKCFSRATTPKEFATGSRLVTC